MIFKWWLFRRTALLPNTKNLIGKKNYRPITCLNTSYKILTSLVEKYMRGHTTVNKIWNERKLEAAEGLLSTVDQLIIDICITEEVKRESSQPGSSLLQLQKGIWQSEWMIRCTNGSKYQGVGLSLSKNWWRSGKRNWRPGVMVKRGQVNGYRYCVGSYNVIATAQLDFVSSKYQYVYYSNIALDTEWETQAITLWKEHIACL